MVKEVQRTRTTLGRSGVTTLGRSDSRCGPKALLHSHRPSTCASATSASGDAGGHLHCLIHRDRRRQLRTGALAGRGGAYSVPRPRWQCAWRPVPPPESRPGPGPAGKRIQPARTSGGSGVGLDHAKLVQGERLVPAGPLLGRARSSAGRARGQQASRAGGPAQLTDLC